MLEEITEGFAVTLLPSTLSYVRQLIKEAEDILKQTGKALKKVKAVPMPRSVIPDVANHVAMAQTSGQPVVLRRQPVAGIVRAAARVVIGGRKAGTNMSWDEYPFVSGRDPLSVKPPSVQPVFWLENSIQGGIISGCYTIEGITVGTPYVVVVTP